MRAPPSLVEAVRGLRREPGAAVGAAAAVALSGAAALPVLALLRVVSLVPLRLASALEPAVDFGGLDAAGIPWSAAAAAPEKLALEGWQGMLLVLAAAAALVVLAAAVAAWSLLTGRTRRRSRELGVRASVGARRADLRRQLLAEGFLVAAAGAAAGLAAGLAVSGAAVELLAPVLRPGPELAVGGAAAVAVGVPALSAVVANSAAAPSLRRARAPLSPLSLLRPAARLGVDLLAAGQAALLLAVLVGAGLVALRAGPAPGFSSLPEGTAVLELDLPTTGPDDTLRRVRSLLSARPDTDRVAYGSPGAWAGIGPRDGTVAECDCSKGGGYVPVVAGPLRHAVVGPNFFRTLDVEVLEGRTFREEDRARGRRIAVVTGVFERRRLAGSGAVGKWIRVAGGSLGSPAYQIVGVVEDRAPGTLASTKLAAPTVFLPAWSHALRRSEVVVHGRPGAKPDPDVLAASVAAAEPEVRVRRASAISSLVRRRSEPFRDSGRILWLLVLASIVLAALGVGGVAADEAWSRRAEVGLRRALGAGRRQAAGLVLGATLRPAALGTALGLILALPVALGLDRLLDVALWRAPVWVVAAAALLAFAAAGAAGPAVAASREDPARALGEPWK